MMDASYLSALALVAALSSAAIAAEPTKRYKDAMDYCAGENVARFDDRVSPANVVAKVLLGICRRQNQDSYETLAAGRSRAWLTGYDGAQLEQFTGFVLWHRAQKTQK